jgi:hypothetical protein
MPCDSPVTVVLPYTYALPDGSISKSVAVPCGRCYICRKNKVDEWSFRLRQEQKICESSYFVTLTYKDVPRSGNNLPTLRPKDCKLYMDRLRVNMKRGGISSPLRYYLVGEYGDEYERPHYHAIIMNSTPDLIVENWTAGLVHLDKVNSNTIAYTVKYLDKGRKVPKHERDDRVKEFSRMSRNLGKNYLTDEMIQWHREDLSRNYIQDGLYKIALPKYYRTRIFNQTELLAQRNLILENKEKLEEKDMNEYYKEYPNHNRSDWYLYKEAQKQANHEKLMNHGKKRKDY